MKRICVFAGSNPGKSDHYRSSAVALGRLIAENGWGLVYGGSQVGLMGMLADTVLSAGGEAIGVMPKGLFRGEIVHTRLTRLIEVGSMHERKAKMHELADAYIALPGGYGTFEELFEAVCWSQIGIHHKPIGLLNVEHFYEPLVKFVESAAEAGFIHRQHTGLLVMESDPAALLHRLQTYERPAQVNKWTELEE